MIKAEKLDEFRCLKPFQQLIRIDKIGASRKSLKPSRRYLILRIMIKKVCLGIFPFFIFSCQLKEMDYPVTEASNRLELFMGTSYYRYNGRNESQTVIDDYYTYFLKGRLGEKAIELVRLNRANYMLEVLANSTYCRVDGGKNWQDARVVFKRKLVLPVYRRAGLSMVNLQELFLKTKPLLAAMAKIKVASGRQLVVADFEIQDKSARQVTFEVEVLEASLVDPINADIMDFMFSRLWSVYPVDSLSETWRKPQSLIAENSREGFVKSQFRNYFRSHYVEANTCSASQYAVNIHRMQLFPDSAYDYLDTFPANESAANQLLIPDSVLKSWYEGMKLKLLNNGAEKDRNSNKPWPNGQKIDFNLKRKSTEKGSRRYAIGLTVYYQNSICDQVVTSYR